MSKNRLIDLNNHLFAQLERLNDEDIKEDELNQEIERSKAIVGVAKAIVENAKVSFEATKFTFHNMGAEGYLPENMLE